MKGEIFFHMKSDIEIPSADGVSIVFVPEKDKTGKRIYSVGVLNMRNNPISQVIINARGSGRIKGVEKHTDSIRFMIQDLPVGAFKAFEILVRNSTELTNEYRISFFENGILYDKKVTVPPKYVSLQKKQLIASIGKPGVIAH